MNQRIDGQGDIVEKSLRLFEEIDDTLGLAKARYAKAYAHWMAGRLTAADEACRNAIDFARRAGDEPSEARIVSARCFILFWGPTHLDEVARYVRESLKWARNRGIRSLEVDTLRILARIDAMQERFPEARARLQEASELRAHGDLLVLVGEFLSTAIVELMAGDVAAAEQVLRRAYRYLVDRHGTGQLVSVVTLLARALAMQDRDEEAMERTLECERLALQTQLDAQVKWRVIRALLLARQGQSEAAEHLAEQAVARTEDWEQDDSTAEVLADHAHVLRLAGKEDRARAHAEQALARYERKGNRVGMRRVQAFLSD